MEMIILVAVFIIGAVLGFYRGAITSGQYIKKQIEFSVKNDCFVEFGGVNVKIIKGVKK